MSGEESALAVEQFGPYRLDELIGRGGMGEVYRAYDTVKKRTVALKRLPEHMANDAEFQARFRREAEVAAQLTEPHIIPIHDFGEIAGQLFIDMRLIAGTDLSALIQHTGPLPAPRAVSIVAQLSSALAAAHAEGLVHRDVKPSNVLISTTDRGEDYVHLVDFGIARTSNATVLTATGSTVGTVDYMSPEQLVQGHGDHRVDVYALGCVLYEALTAEKPFPVVGMPAKMYAHVHTPPPLPSKREPNLPPGLDHVVTRAMAKDPDARYGSATELAIDAFNSLTGGSRPQGFTSDGWARPPTMYGQRPGTSLNPSAPLSAPQRFYQGPDPALDRSGSATHTSYPPPEPEPLARPAAPPAPTVPVRRSRVPVVVLILLVVMTAVATAAVLHFRNADSHGSSATVNQGSLQGSPPSAVPQTMPGIGVPPSVPPGGPTYGDQGSPTGIAPAPANNGGTGNAMNAAPVVPTGSWDTASAVMTDSDGKQTSVKARTFYYCGSTYLTLGGQQVKFETMQRFDITSPTNPADATITLLDGQRLTGVVDASCDYYGDNDIGRVDVGAKSLKSVEFRRNGY